VSRGLPLRAKIFRRAHQPFAEALLPQAVDGHARRQGILPRNEPLRQAKPVARRTGGPGGNCSGNIGRYDLARLIVLAALEHVRRPRLRHFLHYHRGRDRVAGRFFVLDRLPDVLPRLLDCRVGEMVDVVIQHSVGIRRRAFFQRRFDNAAYALAPEPVEDLAILERPRDEAHLVDRAVKAQA
jgi:hypothetical protein